MDVAFDLLFGSTTTQFSCCSVTPIDYILALIQFITELSNGRPPLTVPTPKAEGHNMIVKAVDRV